MADNENGEDKVKLCHTQLRLGGDDDSYDFNEDALRAYCRRKPQQICVVLRGTCALSSPALIITAGISHSLTALAIRLSFLKFLLLNQCDPSQGIRALRLISRFPPFIALFPFYNAVMKASEMIHRTTALALQHCKITMRTSQSLYSEHQRILSFGGKMCSDAQDTANAHKAVAETA